MSDSIWIYGAAGHAKVIIQAIRASGQSIGGVVDDDDERVGTTILDFTIQPTSEVPASVPIVIAIGNNGIRKRIFDHFEDREPGRPWPRVIHPTAIVDPTVQLGDGVVVMAGSVIQADTVIGPQTIINTRSSIDHDVAVGSFSHVCPGATIAGHVSIGDLVMIGTGANVLPCQKIGNASTVGAGACVISEVPANTVFTGVPAREKKQC